MPLDASLVILSDKQLGWALAHHKMVLQVPADWWRNPTTQRFTACSVMVDKCEKIGGSYYLNCTVLKPDAAHRQNHILQLPVWKTQYNVRRLLDLRYNKPALLADLGLTCLPGNAGVSALAAAWMMATTKQLQSARTVTDEDGLEGISILEPDPTNHKHTLRHPRLAPLWLDAATEEMEGLWARGCFKRHLLSDLTKDQRRHVFGSRFHHKIKHHTQTGKIKSCKVRLVVMGNTSFS